MNTLLPSNPNKVLGIFAHPDDEAFGPGGTFAKLVKNGSDVYLICLTDGGDVRRKDELRNSTQILGIKQVVFFNYPDGGLNNRLYHEISNKLIQSIEEWQPELLITFEMRGVSGHIDHVATAMYTAYAFDHTQSPKEIWYYCHDKEHRSSIDKVLGKNGYFIHFPPGYPDDQIDCKVSVEDVWEIKVKAMRCHQTQIKDVNNILKMFESIPKIESFIIKKRD